MHHSMQSLKIIEIIQWINCNGPKDWEALFTVAKQSEEVDMQLSCYVSIFC